jgi:hypothetical protein
VVHFSPQSSTATHKESDPERQIPASASSPFEKSAPVRQSQSRRRDTREFISATRQSLKAEKRNGGTTKALHNQVVLFGTESTGPAVFVSYARRQATFWLPFTHTTRTALIIPKPTSFSAPPHRATNRFSSFATPAVVASTTTGSQHTKNLHSLPTRPPVPVFLCFVAGHLDSNCDFAPQRRRLFNTITTPTRISFWF